MGLTLAEALVEAGGHGKQNGVIFGADRADNAAVYCLDRLDSPPQEFYDAEQHGKDQRFDGTYHYKRVDVQDSQSLDTVISSIANEHGRMDGLIAAAGVQNVTAALDYPPDKITEVRNLRAA